ncbi:FAD/NAD(P)-binding domain-containing protein [Aspergillus homomorphus CBS 101889]|uniref:FAD/NAD(P)-binding domain-containing protein n=1 Tax=Aspergillus homomorphus (strain CBS 101889) TaxID=1450537 RepID=A0A395I019_ASPHC|nr:FAD/NAD(P)-binding domain-containing protein [Aspergillus homomorphus CBS 101889]RAL11874.1 FAD/NAD(P)-binding domain-containing protein [Aspergillus homomorphus CBS 101889]
MEYDHTQDILGQLPLLKSYSHMLLLFPLANDVAHPEIVTALESAIHQLIAAFPFLGGKVVREGQSSTHSGVFVVRPHAAWKDFDHKFLRVEDRTNEVASYAELKATGAPINTLPSNLLAPPRVAFPEPYPDDDDETNPAPVLDFQANWIEGGLALVIAAQHNIIDGNGMFQIVNLLAYSLRHEPFPEQAVREGNIDRRSLIPLLNDDEPMDDHSELKPAIVPGSPSALIPPETKAYLATFRWRNLRFSQAAMAKLYQKATPAPVDASSLDQNQSTEREKITPNDALTAFLWQRLITLRLPHLPPFMQSSTSKITRALDLRRTVNLSPHYMGHMVRTANLRLPLKEVVRLSLYELAVKLRRHVKALHNLQSTRSYATFLAHEDDKSLVAYGGAANPLTDFSCSSIAHVTVPVFGPLGKPTMLRRPSFETPLPGACYIGPVIDESDEEGGWEGLMCLSEREWAMVNADEEWKEVVRYIGTGLILRSQILHIPTSSNIKETQMATEIDIAIIGSGLIGTLLALGLLHRNSPHLRVQVYEQAFCHRELGAGIGFTRAARHCMKRLDPRLDDCLRAVATMNGEVDDPDYNMRFVDGYHTYVDDDDHGPVGIEGKVYKLYAGPRGFEGCHRAQFLEEIMKLMPEGVVQFGKRLERHEYLDSGRIKLVFGDGTVKEVDGVIGCDGIKSRVRDLLFPNGDYRPRYAHQLAYRGLIPMDQAIAHLGRHRALLQHMHCGPHAHVLHFPVANQKLLNVVAFVPDPKDWDVAKTPRTHLLETFATWTPFLRRLLSLLPPNLTKWPIFDLYENPPPTYAMAQMCVAGDAAHASSPHHGAGAGVGVEDALALVTALGCAEADIVGGRMSVPKALEVAFRAYSDVRYERSLWVMRSSRDVCRAYEWEVFGDDEEDMGDMGRVFEEIRRRTMKVWGLDVDGMVAEVQGAYWRGTWGFASFSS